MEKAAPVKEKAEDSRLGVRAPHAAARRGPCTASFLVTGEARTYFTASQSSRRRAPLARAQRRGRGWSTHPFGETRLEFMLLNSSERCVRFFTFAAALFTVTILAGFAGLVECRGPASRRRGRRGPAAGTLHRLAELPGSERGTRIVGREPSGMSALVSAMTRAGGPPRRA